MDMVCMVAQKGCEGRRLAITIKHAALSGMPTCFCFVLFGKEKIFISKSKFEGAVRMLGCACGSQTNLDLKRQQREISTT